MAFIQCMPEKPIKYTLTLFVDACASITIMLVFKMYFGYELNTIENSAVAVGYRLINAEGLISARYKLFYTDKWYTSTDLAKHIWVNQKWIICATITPRYNKYR